MQINNSLLVAMLIATGGGFAIGMQSVIINSVSGGVGAVRTAFFIHVGGSVIGAAMLGLLWLAGQGGTQEATTMPQWTPRLISAFLLAGTMGMVIIPSIALAFPRTGLVAGQILLIGGQTLIALIVDTLGLAGAEPIPLDRQRLLGLALMVLAVYLLLPTPGTE
ncbi:hypothetical protein HC928_23800 [bacterium]|nr:hypothetical protein [bacterium]